jgi:hypothetical protein
VALLALAMALGACDSGNQPNGPDGSTDGGDDGGGPDAEPDTGLTVQFAYLGPGGDPVPGDSEVEFAAFNITSMTMQLHKLKLIGDTAPSGGLQSDSCVLEFPWTRAPRVVYAGAPSGLYSELDFRVERTYHDEEVPEAFDDVRLALKVEGQAIFETGNIDFVYIDDAKVDVELYLDIDIPLGEPGSIGIDLDLGQWFTGVPWADLAADVDGPGSGGPGSGGPGGGGPGGGGPGGGDDGGDDDDDDDDEGNGTGIRIGMGGNQEVARLMRENLADSFSVRRE